ncbi:hypothetical protein GCM10009785_22290 [Brooklawnia cerclae]
MWATGEDGLVRVLCGQGREPTDSRVIGGEAPRIEARCETARPKERQTDWVPSVDGHPVRLGTLGRAIQSPPGDSGANTGGTSEGWIIHYLSGRISTRNLTGKAIRAVSDS